MHLNNKLRLRKLQWNGWLHIKVSQPSAFQTISVRTVSIKIINYSGSIIGNLNYTNANKTTCNEKKKPHSYSNKKKIYTGLFFVEEGFWTENVIII